MCWIKSEQKTVYKTSTQLKSYLLRNIWCYKLISATFWKTITILENSEKYSEAYSSSSSDIVQQFGIEKVSFF